jgi:predicted dehydrogenase
MQFPISRRSFQSALFASSCLSLASRSHGSFSSKKYRVGIIGATGRGDYGHAVDVPFTKLPNLEVISVADADASGREKAKARLKVEKVYADYREMLDQEKLDLVAICPRWIDQHHAMLMAAAQANCHVYMEKPFCRSLLESDEVAGIFRSKGLKLAIAHTAQYSPVLHTVLQLVQDGVIGSVLELRGRGKEDQRGGAEDLWVLGSHIFGMMRSFGGGTPIECSARITQNNERIRKANVFEGNEGLGPLAGNALQANYQFANGVQASFASRKAMAANPSRFALQVFGSKGVLEIESGYLAPAYLLRDASWSPGRSGKNWEKVTSAGIAQPEARSDGNYEGGHLAAIRDLIQAIEQDRQPLCGLDDALGITEMILAAFESERLGTPVSIPLASRQHPLTLIRE